MLEPLERIKLVTANILILERKRFKIFCLKWVVGLTFAKLAVDFFVKKPKLTNFALTF